MLVHLSISFSDCAICFLPVIQAMSFFKASFHKARRYAEDARKLSINDETKTVLCEVFDAKAATEKMLADRNLIIGQIHEELGQANAEISALSRNHSQLGEELMNVTKELTSSKEEYARLCEEVEDTRGAAIKESHYGPIGTNQSPVHEDAAQTDTADKEENKQPTNQATSINFKVIGQVFLFLLPLMTVIIIPIDMLRKKK